MPAGCIAHCRHDLEHPSACLLGLQSIPGGGYGDTSPPKPGAAAYANGTSLLAAAAARRPGTGGGQRGGAPVVHPVGIPAAYPSSPQR